MQRVLYCVMNPCCMSKALLHRLDVNKGKNSVVLIDAGVYGRRNLIETIEKMEKNNIFSEIISDNLFFDVGKHYALDEYENYIKDFYNEILKKKKMCIEDFSEIVVANDWWDGRFNLYLNIIQKKYTWLQTDANSLQDKIRFECSNECKQLFEKYQALSAFAPYAVPWLTSNCSDKLKQRVGMAAHEYNYNIIIKKMPDDVIKKVIMCYGIEEVKENSILFLPNSYGYMYSWMSKNIKDYINYDFFGNDQILYMILRMICDYYLENSDYNIYVKPHPNDPIDNIRLKKIMDENTELLSEAPWEWTNEYLLRKKLNFKYIIGMASTSLESIDSKLCNKKIVMGDSFIRTWFFYDELVAILRLFTRIYDCIISDYNICEQSALLADTLHLEYSYTPIQYKQFRDKVMDNLVILNCFELLREGEDINKLLNKAERNSTIVLFNLDATSQYIDEDNIRFVSGLELVRMGENAKYIDLLGKSNIYVYSKSEEIHLMLYRQKYEVYKKNQKINLNLKFIGNENVKNIMTTKLLQKKLTNEIEQNSIYRKRINNLVMFINREKNELIRKIKEIDDIHIYLDTIQMIKDDCIVLLAVKDTVGDCLSNTVLKQLNDLGFKNINKTTWRMYAGILSKEICIDKVANVNEEPINETIMINHHSIEISSNSWRKKNIAQIIVNGVDYAVNIRGINIVIIDRTNGNLVDSIGYDSHTIESRFVRKNS